jgi:hypothetical protein
MTEDADRMRTEPFPEVRRETYMQDRIVWYPGGELAVWFWDGRDVAWSETKRNEFPRHAKAANPGMPDIETVQILPLTSYLNGQEV